MYSDRKLVDDYLAGSDAAFAVIHKTYGWRIRCNVIDVIGAGAPDVDDALSSFWLRMIEPEGYLSRWSEEDCSLRTFLLVKATQLTKNFVRDEARSRKKELDGALVSSDSMGIETDDDGYTEAELVDGRGWGVIDDGHYRGTAETAVMTNHDDLANELITEESLETLALLVCKLQPKYWQPILEIIDEGWEHGCLQAKAAEHNLNYNSLKSTWRRLEAKAKEQLK